MSVDPASIISLASQIISVVGDIARSGGDAEALLSEALASLRAKRDRLAAIEAAEDERLKDIYEGEHRP